jgi:hypothetical protein
VIEELLPQALHNTFRHANNRVERGHGRLKARLRPMVRPEDRPQRDGDHGGSRVHPEPSPWSLRTRHRCPKQPSSLRCSLRRTRLDDLNEATSDLALRATPERTTQQRHFTEASRQIFSNRWITLPY